MPAGAQTGAAGAGDDSKFVDAQDGWLDLGEFLDTAYGFVPVVSPITEPAVGYGAAGALVFIDRNEPDAGGKYVRPNIAAVGGMLTENDSHGVLAGHLGTWRGGRVQSRPSARPRHAIADTRPARQFLYSHARLVRGPVGAAVPGLARQRP
jgi:hypothetical protein